MTLVRPLQLLQNNDETAVLAITDDTDGSPFPLTGIELDFFMKVQEGDSDTASTTIKLSTTGGSPAISVTDAANGLATIVIAASHLQITNYNFYRLDVVGTGGAPRNTACYGPLQIVAM